MNSAGSANHDKIQQESIPGGCVLPAHHRTGGFSVKAGLPGRDPAGDRDHLDRDLPDRDSPGQRLPWVSP